jgi:hypothetical protein
LQQAGRSPRPALFDSLGTSAVTCRHEGHRRRDHRRHRGTGVPDRARDRVAPAGGLRQHRPRCPLDLPLEGQDLQGREFEAVSATIRELHSYELPEILSFGVGRGESHFLQWIADSTDKEADFSDEEEDELAYAGDSDDD